MTAPRSLNSLRSLRPFRQADRAAVLDRRVVAQPVDGDARALDVEVVDVAGVDGDVGALDGEGVDVLRGDLDVRALDRQRVEVTHQVESAAGTLNDIVTGDLGALTGALDVLPGGVRDGGVVAVLVVILVAVLVAGGGRGLGRAAGGGLGAGRGGPLGIGLGRVLGVGALSVLLLGLGGRRAGVPGAGAVDGQGAGAQAQGQGQGGGAGENDLGQTHDEVLSGIMWGVVQGIQYRPVVPSSSQCCRRTATRAAMMLTGTGLARTGTFCAVGDPCSQPGAFDAVGDRNPVPGRADCPRPEGNAPVRVECPRPGLTTTASSSDLRRQPAAVAGDGSSSARGRTYAAGPHQRCTSAPRPQARTATAEPLSPPSRPPPYPSPSWQWPSWQWRPSSWWSSSSSWPSWRWSCGWCASWPGPWRACPPAARRPSRR